MSRPKAVALTGGIAAGKSEALAAFARHGAEVVSSDLLVHELLAADEDVRTAIRERWGIDAADRKGVAEIVFRDADELDWLEKLLHPRVVALQQESRDESTAALLVFEIPLLYETGGESRFDAVVVITAPREIREARRGSFADREARLIPDEEKVARADFAYVNDGTLEELDDFVAGVVERLTSS